MATCSIVPSHSYGVHTYLLAKRNISPLGCFPVAVAGRTFLPILPGTFWIHGRNNVTEIPLIGGTAVRYSRFYEFHSYTLCREVSHRELFQIIQSLPLALEVALLVISQDS